MNKFEDPRHSGVNLGSSVPEHIPSRPGRPNPSRIGHFPTTSLTNATWTTLDRKANRTGMMQGRRDCPWVTAMSLMIQREQLPVTAFSYMTYQLSEFQVSIDARYIHICCVSVMHCCRVGLRDVELTFRRCRATRVALRVVGHGHAEVWRSLNDGGQCVCESREAWLCSYRMPLQRQATTHKNASSHASSC